ncbi:MAG: GNAT family N-acetyltransferase [Patescibacteria group bacterium]
MKREGFNIKILKNFRQNDLKELNDILLQWSAKRKEITPLQFRKLIKKSHVIAMYDKKTMIGTVTLIELHKLSGLKGIVEHLMIDEKYRGRGLGEKLMKYSVNLAKKLEMKNLYLTCEPERIAANKLYQKIGFKAKETNFYQLTL